MSLQTFDTRYHLVGKPNKIFRDSILTSTAERVEEYLIEQHGKGAVVLHFVELEKQGIRRERTCRYCRQTRVEIEAAPPTENPALFDETLWRII